MDCIIVKEEKSGAEKIREFLADIYGNQSEPILCSLTSEKRLLLNRKIKNGLRLSDQFNYFANESGITKIDGLNSIYAFLLNSYCCSEQLYFLLDGLYTKLGTFSNFRENPLRYGFDTWKESKFELHLGLWKKFHIW